MKVSSRYQTKDKMIKIKKKVSSKKRRKKEQKICFAAKMS
jgi:hypothetical protein